MWVAAAAMVLMVLGSLMGRHSPLAPMQGPCSHPQAAARYNLCTGTALHCLLNDFDMYRSWSSVWYCQKLCKGYVCTWLCDSIVHGHAAATGFQPTCSHRVEQLALSVMCSMKLVCMTTEMKGQHLALALTLLSLLCIISGCCSCIGMS